MVLAQAPNYEEALLIANMETDDVVAARRRRPWLLDERLALNRRELDRIIAARAGLPAATGDDDAIAEHATAGVARGRRAET